MFDSPKALNQDKQPTSEINVQRSSVSTMSSITTSPSLQCISLASSFARDFEPTQDTTQEAKNIIIAMEEVDKRQKQIEESQKRLLDAAKKNPLVGEMLKSNKR